MKTISGREITATSSQKRRTFTIRTGEGLKYRTNRMTKEEFYENEFNTSDDWQDFLNKSQNYYLVKK